MTDIALLEGGLGQEIHKRAMTNAHLRMVPHGIIGLLEQQMISMESPTKTVHSW